MGTSIGFGSAGVETFELAALKRAFEATVFALEQALARQAELDREIATLAGTAP